MHNETPVNVFWDIENCAVPSSTKGVQVVNAIRHFALQRGILKNISAFANLKHIREELRADMQESGVLLHDVTRKANSSDLAILVELLKLVIDNKPPHCIILISGDRDFANVISTLTARKYQVFLIHSPQASEVLRNAATEAVEWNELLKGRGKLSIMPIERQFTPQAHYNDKFQPLLEFLIAKGKPQVEFSELGNLIPFSKFGYTKLKDYIFDAASSGLVKCGANKNIHWVALLNGHAAAAAPPPSPLNMIPPITMTPSLGNGIPLTPGLSQAYRTPPPDRTLVVRHLLSALESLKKDYFKPTESTLQKRIKQLNLPLQKLDWEDIVNITKSHYFIVEGEKPNRTIFPPQGPFEGVDPSHPVDNFTPRLWKTMQQFFIDVHPVIQIGRYGFAMFLKEKGPPEVREMPLGSITELVQLALHRQLLRYHKTQVSTILPDLENQDGQNHNGLSSLHYVQFSEFGDEQRSNTPDGSDDEEVRGENEDERSRLVGVTFSWPYTGTSVLVTGSFFNWRNTIALHKREPESSTTTATVTTTTSTPIPPFSLTPPLSPTSSAPATPTILSTPTAPNFVPSSLLATAVLSPKITYYEFPPSLFQPSLSLSRDFRERDFNNNQPGATGAMCEPEDVFSTVLYLPPGKYEYKFIVDGAWHYDPHQPVITDEVGNLNNIVEIGPPPTTLGTEPLPSELMNPVFNTAPVVARHGTSICHNTLGYYVLPLGKTHRHVPALNRVPNSAKLQSTDLQQACVVGSRDDVSISKLAWVYFTFYAIKWLT